MSDAPKILAFAGSARRESFNRKLLAVAVEGARAAGAEVTVLDLADYPLPIFDADVEARDGLPEKAIRLKDHFLAHDGLLLACPEYNSSITPLMKNTIDWVSRPASRDEKPLSAYAGKVAALVATSPGAIGGLRGLVTVRSILGNLGVLVLPKQVAVPKAREAFDDEGRLVDEKSRAAVESVGAGLAATIAKLVSRDGSG
jgi:NAD(P)H-dependent FMN reductase